ncbi:zf-HC2 domain-containing protein [Pelotomaculum isophthalicicum JI]|uniref:Anti-sigma-W factor RsiW n=1 Tax=Pelotomaculum isophthalicicum JI TaxID=947010 RepID=A0A9X4H727_9FIRM|nr:zf-HC2 domain-containing protein [Pelotomaculum isophthalicicum]MDF9409623.1 zf-HC2 domain-containing protein [Pelotomaculum isophthalicicum JI]
MPCPSDMIWECYLDGELPPDQHSEVERHLAQCLTCSTRVAVIREENEMIAAALAIPVPPDLAVHIERRLASYSEMGIYWLWFFLPLLGLTSALVALRMAWLPLLAQLRDILLLLVGGDLLLRACLETARMTLILAGNALRGSPVLPVLTLFTVPLLLMKLKLLTGGRANV